MSFHVIIPARLESTRLPGKLLMELYGQSIIERVYRQVLLANPKSITIATDNDAIFKKARDFGANVLMTASTHQSGTDRIAEVVAKADFMPEDIIVNVQGDEPLIAPELIVQVAASLASSNVPMATLCWPIDDEATANNPNVVKVVRDVNNLALYFSRCTIPYYRDKTVAAKHLFRHIGLYAYRAGFLLDIVKWPVSELEAAEALEQLRVLGAGFSIKVDEACVCPLQDINTPEDFEKIRMYLSP